MNAIELQVQCMTCGTCVKHVSAALRPLAGVNDVAVDLPSGRVTVSGAPDRQELLAALETAGYPAQLATPASGSSAKAGSGCGGSGGCGCH